MNQVLEQLEKNASLTVEKCELRSFDGNPVIYMENSFTFNDEVLDQMIEKAKEELHIKKDERHISHDDFEER